MNLKIGSVDLHHARGFAAKATGLAKEIVGTVSGNDRLVKEGEAQQARATEELKALRQEAEAEIKDAKAQAAEQRERAAQRAKASA
ncbi:MAG: CsbD family protein [Acidimicrobiales bacterium]